MKKKRSFRCIMTNEARVLKELREDRGLSMRRSGQLIGLSDSYICHLETGRLDFPKGERLERLLSVFDIKPKSFFERVRNYSQKITPRDELLELIQKANDSQVVALLGIVKNIVS